MSLLIRYLITAILVIVSASVFAEEAVYVGVDECMICHLPHYNSWKETRMSQAFELLKPGIRGDVKKKAGLNPDEDYTKNGFCLECHVTGYNATGGFTNTEETPGLEGIQCEMCHGPGSIYSQMMLKKRGTFSRKDYIEKGGLTMPSKENNVCVKKCHNDKSPFVSGQDFNFEDRKAIGTHRHDLRYIYLPFDL